MIVNKINTYLSQEKLDFNEFIAQDIGRLAEWSFKRQFMQNNASRPELGLSQAGKCPRELAYKFHGIGKQGKEIDSRAKIIFWQGDLVELMIVKLARLAGCNVMATGLDQLEVECPIDRVIPLADPETVFVKGHPDGIIIADNTYLLEVKSMSSYAFKRFEKGDIDDSYRTQMNMYMRFLNLHKCVIVAMSKDSGVLGEYEIEFDLQIFNYGLTNLALAINSTPDKLPEGRYKVDDKGFYPWQCLYCAWWGKCKPNAEKVLVSRSYRLKEKKGE